MMVELTTAEAITTALGIFSLGAGIGYKQGIGQTITTTKNICQITVDNKQRNLAIEKIFVNGKQSDISCSFLVKGKCELIGTRCKYI